jgi:hypothetical protein
MVTSPATQDPRARSGEASSSCTNIDDNTVRAVGTVHWSDGYVDTATATYEDPGTFALLTERMWSFTFYLTAPPDGTIGSLSCTPGGSGGPLYWP